MNEAFGASPRTFPLRGNSQPFEITPQGVHHPASPPARGHAFSAWDELTHVASSARALWIGTRKSVYVISRRAFVEPGAPEEIFRAILAQLSARPNGQAQIARMARVERTANAHTRLRATWGLAIACCAVFLLQLFGGDVVELVGHFSGPLVADGDAWRLVTANFLHAFPSFPLHLVLNVIGLVLFGAYVERPLGAARTVCIMTASGIASMGAAWIAGQSPVVGVSGVVFGLVGSVLWLDYRRSETLPAWWRVPRRTLWVLLALNVALGLLPFIAASAHFGGLVAGALATAAVTGEAPTRRAPPAWVTAACGLSLALVGLSVGSATGELLREGDVLARYTARLARLPGISPVEANNTAWMIAIAPDSSEELKESALLLAERAVSETDRSDPHSLDTLAELQFLLGDPETAVRTIDEAIALEPGEPYYQEQRRRFLGERDADDRPPEPGLVLPPRRHPPPPEDAISI